jgi:hypothetical protein|tara:strand:+ start:1596 stop:2549 length:954 start_codon:yes stop_codon:yes gene_type:complete
MTSYEFEKYLSDYSTIKTTIATYGVAIIPLLSEEECNKMIEDKWELLEHLTSEFEIPIDRHNKETYKQIINLYPSHKMLIQHWKVGHSKLAWNVRQNKKVIEVFKHIWNTDDLIVSFDGVGIYILDKPTRKNTSWFHVDQSYTRNNFECIQSWINAYDTNEGDATLVILENSHNFHKECRDEFNITDTKDWYKLTKENIAFYENNNCLVKSIKCPKGYGVFWDSRTVHYGDPVQKIDNFNYRCVVYICMVPRNFATQKQLNKRLIAFENSRMTTHYPHKVKLFPKYPQTYGKPLMNIMNITLEDIKTYITPDGLKLI